MDQVHSIAKPLMSDFSVGPGVLEVSCILCGNYLERLRMADLEEILRLYLEHKRACQGVDL